MSYFVVQYLVFEIWLILCYIFIVNWGLRVFQETDSEMLTNNQLPREIQSKTMHDLGPEPLVG